MNRTDTTYKKIKYIPVREEHGYPQNDVMTILLAEAVKPDGNIKDAMKVIRKDPSVKDSTLRSLAEKHQISNSLFNRAAWFMRAPVQRRPT